MDEEDLRDGNYVEARRNRRQFVLGASLIMVGATASCTPAAQTNKEKP